MAGATTMPTTDSVMQGHSQSMNEQLQMIEIQRKISHDQMMVQMLSNIMKSDDDTKKGVVANMK